MFIANLDKKSFVIGFVVALVMVTVINLLTLQKSTVVAEIKGENNPLYIDRQEAETSYVAENSASDGTLKGKRLFIEDHGTSNTLNKWQAVITDKLSAEQMLFFSDDVPIKIITAINSDELLFTTLLAQIKKLDHSQQRQFLVQVLGALATDKKKYAADELLHTGRVIDQMSALPVIMSIEGDSYKAEMSSYILQTYLSDSVLDKLLQYLNTESHHQVALNIEAELYNLYQSSTQPNLKGLTLQVLMKIQPNNKSLLSQVTELVNSANEDDNFHGLNILNQQLNDYGVPLSAEQQNDLYSYLTLIADDGTQSIKNRMKALHTLEVLETYDE